MNVSEATLKELVDHFLKMRIVQTNRRLYACLNRKECAQRRQKQLEKLLATAPHPERMVPMTSRPSPPSIQPPGQRQAVPVAQAVPVGVPVGVPVTQPIVPYEFRRSYQQLPHPPIVPYRVRRRYQYETEQPDGSRRIVGQWDVPKPEVPTSVPDRRLRTRVPDDEGRLRTRLPDEARLPPRPSTRVPGPSTPKGSPLRRRSPPHSPSVRPGLINLTEESPTPSEKAGDAIEMVVPDDAEGRVELDPGCPQDPRREQQSGIQLEHLQDRSQLQLGAPLGELVITPAAVAPVVSEEEAALLEEGDRRKTEDATHTYNWQFSQEQGRFTAPPRRWKIKKNELQRNKWAREHPPPPAPEPPEPHPVARVASKEEILMLLEGEKDVTEDEFYRYFWRWNASRRMFLSSFMRDPEIKTPEEQAQWRATH